MDKQCANCDKPAVQDYFPFCSQRCKNIDLHKWLTEAYVIKGESVEDLD